MDGPTDSTPAIPPFQDFLVPLLEVLSDGSERRRQDLINRVIDHVGAGEDQRAVILPSGGSKIADHAGWALSDLHIIKAVSRPRHGVYTISERGRSLLDTHPQGMTVDDLWTFREYVEYKERKRRSD